MRASSEREGTVGVLIISVLIISVLECAEGSPV